ncbi:hypothetical protein EKO29_12440 [Colwellia sp. Arc7-635]|uniref:hypothetical protein n=1 Tax=Colwellia sp. Arc7-635 TaxID=2497879 RepID=UPI000F854301|nr:hypothetical protein [Colwellia sp. Arc7-635]AZQ84735.1 hypothetical protein EKO29_12440 [Colwellia sp. Arc7-635]
MKITNVKIDKCNTGISLPKNSTATIDNAEITNTGTAIEERDDPITPQVTKLFVAIKKPRANNNEGWKIMIVGALLAFLLTLAGMALYDFYVKPTLSKTLNPQSQTEEVEALK